MQVGTDSYISVTEADGLIEIVASEELSLLWAALPPAKKELYLKRAALEINSLPLRGEKLNRYQQMAFPRKRGRDRLFIHSQKWANLTENGVLNASLTFFKEALNNGVDFAQAALAGSYLDKDKQQRADLQAQGVQSFSVGDFSESYTKTKRQLVSPEAEKYLKGWINGAVRIL